MTPIRYGEQSTNLLTIRRMFQITYFAMVKKNSEPLEIAQAFNEFYTNVAPKLDHSLPPSTTDPLSFLRGDYPHSMTIPMIIPQDVITVINSLKNQLAIPLSIL